MKQPDFDHHRKCYELLKQVWDDPELVRNPRWQNEVEAILGPSECRVPLFPGDEVELLVDGYRGKFKGHTAIVTHADGYGLGVRVPGKFAPGETEEYCGPYNRNQVKLLRRASRP